MKATVSPRHPLRDLSCELLCIAALFLFVLGVAAWSARADLPVSPCANAVTAKFTNVDCEDARHSAHD